MWRSLFALAQLLLLLSWAVPWYRALTPATYGASPLRAGLVFGLWWLGTYGLAAGLERLRIRVKYRHRVLGGWFVLGCWAAFGLLLYTRPEAQRVGNWVTRPLRSLSDVTVLVPDEVLVALVMLGVGAHALRAASGAVSLYRARRAFFLGLGMLLAYLFLNTMVTGETPGGMVYLFLFSGLLAMGTARLAVIRRLRGGQPRAFDLRWLLALGAASAGVVGAAGVLAGYLASEQGGLLRWLPLWAAGVVLVVLALLLTPLVLAMLYLLYAAFSWLQRLELAPALEQLLLRLQVTFGALAVALRHWLEVSGVTAWGMRVQRLGRPVFWLGLLVLVGGLALLEVRWQRARREGRAGVTTWETLPVEGNWLARLRAAMAVRRRWMAQEVRRLLPRSRRWLMAARIRRWYAHLMRLCARAGCPRPQAVTPLEFLDTLSRLAPGCETEARLLTQAYLAVRYGEQSESGLDLQAVESAWRRLRAALLAQHR